MGTVPIDIRRLLSDCEYFVAEILHDENLSESTEETRNVLLNNFEVVKGRFPQEFSLPSRSVEEDGSDDNRSSSLGRSAPSDDASDYQDEASEFFDDIPILGAQDLVNVLKQGYLEKKRKDHSFFGSEWQKRWCVLNNTVFYYFGSEKDKQQKGSFHIGEYGVQLASNLRKDSKKNACFEFTAPGRRTFQFTASSPQEAREWVDQINFVLRDLSSNVIPVDDDEDEEETYDDIEGLANSTPPRLPKASHISRGGGGQEMMEADEDGDDIYEELPEEENPEAADDSVEDNKSAGSTEYANFYQSLWDCQADEPDELGFKRGDLIYIISKEYNIHGWWVGELEGSVGIVPKDFLQPAYIL
ncbi:src kinase-associated phosphoprotein 1 [Austrofundulus limnaeus]|uniref:Src kinase-associated phosphoprotein 1 n=1 Tax=Austrofundulus limnaeus TaxID=52670 RepID=A0A2I4BR49_AUSLI|nr:PREDICTED: src kinase-associated phosphoprotein 1 [Austrofundulus limnaeus]XP_013870209.1 PREDICTED: src kinase-associated phosphoprotein 1 [Austrofundulus limnaeus]